MMHMVDAERVELVAYKLENVARTWFDQLKKGRDEDAPVYVGLALKKLYWGISFPEN